jgi:hypothetical protein
MLGSWNVNVTVGKYPQKVASALADLNLVGALYTPIAYIGSQQVNGTNHAVLAKQTLTTGKDVNNIVILTLNEKEDKVVLSGIERIVEQGGELGGIKIADDFTVTDEAKDALKAALADRLGIEVTPRALLGTQVTKGMNYILFVTTASVTPNPEVEAAVVVVNSLTKNIGFSYVLGGHDDVNQLGYAFTWLMQKNVSLGKPLGEWP